MMRMFSIERSTRYSSNFKLILSIDFRTQYRTVDTNPKELDYNNGYLCLTIVDMKCLSLKQPYAELSLRKKDYRIEKLDTSFRGKFLIHASMNIDKERSNFLGIDHNKLICGAIIGSAVLYDIKQYRNKIELERDRNKHLADIKKFGFCRYGFMIKNAHRLRRSIPYPGMLKFFEVDYPINF